MIAIVGGKGSHGKGSKKIAHSRFMALEAGSNAVSNRGKIQSKKMRPDLLAATEMILDQLIPMEDADFRAL